MTAEVSLERTYTIEEFTRLPDDGYTYELAQGRLERMSPTGGEHGRIASGLHTHLTNHVWAHGLGETFAAETAFVLDPATRTVRAADVAFVAMSRLAGVGEDAVPFPPDLVAEVISPSDRATGIKGKVAEYQKAGVPLIWVVNPRYHTVEVYHPRDTQPLTLGMNDELDGEAVVPGFRLPVRAIFARGRATTHE